MSPLHGFAVIRDDADPMVAADRLQQVLVRVKFAVNHSRQRLAGDDHGRHVLQPRISALLLTETLPIDLGHVQVEQHETDARVFTKLLQAGGPTFRHHHVESCALEQAAEQSTPARHRRRVRARPAVVRQQTIETVLAPLVRSSSSARMGRPSMLVQLHRAILRSRRVRQTGRTRRRRRRRLSQEAACL